MDSFPPIGRQIFLDRFAMKDLHKSLSPGDFVLAILPGEDKRTSARVVEVRGRDVRVSIGENGTSREETLSIDNVEKPVETLPSEMWKRVATAVAKVELDREKWATEFERLMQVFVPGGRILAMAGVEEQLSAYNCAVLPAPVDSIQGIYKTAQDLADYLRRGSGVGIPLSSLRPRGAFVKGVNGTSSGPVMWSQLFSNTTGLIRQGGSRTGALMLIMDDWHPDVEEFIKSKREHRFNTNANQSVAISDAFMDAVHADGEWKLEFPDVNHIDYEADWNGDFTAWRRKHPGATVTYKTLKARDLWNQIIDSAWASAEPGLFFVDRWNAMSNSWYYDHGQIRCCNPCGEQGLPASGVCNLGHLQLHKFAVGPIGEAEVDWPGLAYATRLAVRFLDDVIDYTQYFDPRQELQQKSERRVGMGTLGLAELLIRCGITYGANEECLEFLDKLYCFIAENAYTASTELALEKGKFPAFATNEYLQSGFMQSMPEAIRMLVRERGIRNVTLLTQAPTGSVGSMVGTSTGIEPFPALEWDRKVRAGEFTERVAIIDEYQTQEEDTVSKLPPYFVTAATMTPADHAYTQAKIQRWVDSGISKTSNMPAETTAAEVGEFYRLLHELGCKGGTVYRDGSRKEQVIYTKKDSTTAKSDVPRRSSMTEPEVFEMKPWVTYSCSKMEVPTPAGPAHVKLVFDHDGHPREVFAKVGQEGKDIHADMAAMGKLISLVLRMRSDVPAERRLALAVKALKGIGGSTKVGYGPNRAISIPDSLGRAVEAMIEQGTPRPAKEAVPPAHSLDWAAADVAAHPAEGDGEPDVDNCPECHDTRFFAQEGCKTCQECGYSECA